MGAAHTPEEDASIENLHPAIVDGLKRESRTEEGKQVGGLLQSMLENASKADGPLHGIQPLGDEGHQTVTEQLIRGVQKEITRLSKEDI